MVWYLIHHVMPQKIAHREAMELQCQLATTGDLNCGSTVAIIIPSILPDDKQHL